MYGSRALRAFCCVCSMATEGFGQSWISRSVRLCSNAVTGRSQMFIGLLVIDKGT